MLSNPLLIRLLVTALLVVVLVALRFLIGRWIRGGGHILQETQRRQLFYLRTALTAAFIIGAAVIWGGQLQNLVLSLTAVMVAVVIATKELLMCLSGFLLRTTARLFQVGDWIQCNGLRGEVTDHTLLSTTMLEIAPPEDGYGYTGRMLTLPNSLFLSHPVQVTPFARQFVLHRFHVTLDTTVDPSVALSDLQGLLDARCAPFRDEARAAAQSIDRHLGVDLAGPEPVATVGTSDIGKTQFRALVFCPQQDVMAVERDIVRDFLQRVARGAYDPQAAAAET